VPALVFAAAVAGTPGAQRAVRRIGWPWARWRAVRFATRSMRRV